ncbi:7860_t:CDS:2, partial [Funneliformis geosporum]
MKRKNSNTTGALNNSVTFFLRDILNGMAKDNISTSFPIQKNHHKNSSIEKKEIQAKKALTIKKKQEDSIIPIDEINKLDDLVVNIKKIGREPLKRNTEKRTKIRYVMNDPSRQLSNKSQQKSARSKKNILEKNISKVSKASISFSVGKPDAVITDFSSILSKHTAIYNEGIKHKKLKALEAFDDSQTKHIKINSNTQSILEKIVEKQLKQCTTINTLQESNDELKHEIFENCKLLQNILTILTSGLLTTINELMQQGGNRN